MTSTKTTLTTKTIETDDGREICVPAVRVWHIYEQSWRVYPVTAVPDAVLGSLPQAERDMIEDAQ